MAAALAVDDGLSGSRWLISKPYILPCAISAAPVRLGAIKLASAFSDSPQAVDAGLNGHLSSTLDGVDLLTERI